MAVAISNTPNPNALKFTVGVAVGGPKTYVAGGDVDEPWAAELLALDGVTSVFASADFVTLTKAPQASWEDIAPAASEILERAFS
ncbi:MAG TPA: scaffolding protein [Actinobacteria bacterium]|nr:scaffolding protein [Actinomycetota bacterium]